MLWIEEEENPRVFRFLIAYKEEEQVM